MRLTTAQMNEQVTVTCYGNKKQYTRKNALDFFRRAILNCDPDSSESDRYQGIYIQVVNGDTIVSDEN